MRTAVYCNGPPGDKQLNVSPAECRASTVPAETECQLSCVLDGFRLVGDDTRVCLQSTDGLTAWKPEQWPTCVGKHCRMQLIEDDCNQWCRSVVKYVVRVSQVRPSTVSGSSKNYFYRPHFRHKSFILDDVKLAVIKQQF